MTSTNQADDKLTNRIGGVIKGAMIITALVYFCAKYFWHTELKVVNYMMFGFGALVVISLVVTLIFGDRAERLSALFMAILIVVIVAVSSI